MPHNLDNDMPVASALQQIIGALLFAGNRPLSINDIRNCLHEVAAAAAEDESDVTVFKEASPLDIRDSLENIRKELARLELGFDLVEINGTFRLQTQAACGRWIRHLLKLDRPGRLSKPALETLAIIAYRQPVSRSEIESIRGVMVDHVLKMLIEMNLVRIVGRSELPGRPFIYGTTTTFLEHFGLSSLKELDELDPTLQRSATAERKAIHMSKSSEEPN